MKLRTLYLILTMALLAAACGTDGGGDSTVPTDAADGTTTTSGSEEPAVTTTVPPGEVTTTAAEPIEGVHVAGSDFGEILVDPDGFTLYVFDVDVGGESACYDACAGLWPPVPADAPIGSGMDASLFGSTPRTDGEDQLTINDKPLYRYTPDTGPGDAMGQGFNDVWWVVDAAGDAVEASAADEIVIDYGY